MLLKFFELERGGLAYVRRDPTARVLLGHPDLTQGLIDTISGRQRFTAGVLTEIDRLKPETRGDAIRQANYQLRAGLPKDSLSIVWVGHSGKGRDESHVVGANLELITGRPYSLYLDRIDRHRFQAWQEHFNLTHGLPDPSSQLRIRPDYSKSRLPIEHQNFLMDVWNRVHEQVESGLVTSRMELVAHLRSVGYNVRADSHTGKPLEQPVLTLSDGSILRLKGSCYYRVDFNPGMLLPRQEVVRPEVIHARINALRGIVIEGLEFRAHHTVGHLFGRAEQRRVEPGGARHHLAKILQTKLEEWEIPEPIHPMFGPAGIARLNTLIELNNEGLDLLKIPVLKSPTTSEPAPGPGNSGPQTRTVSTADEIPLTRGPEQPFLDLEDDHIPTGIRSIESDPAISATARSEEKTPAPQTSNSVMQPAANSDATPSKRRCKKRPKKTEPGHPETPGDLG